MNAVGNDDERWSHLSTYRYREVRDGCDIAFSVGHMGTHFSRGHDLGPLDTRHIFLGQNNTGPYPRRKKKITSNQHATYRESQER